jgi:hypothetical protein
MSGVLKAQGVDLTVLDLLNGHGAKLVFPWEGITQEHSSMRQPPFA